MAKKNPENFVLKPQKEGGGNNVYGADIRPFLAKMKNPEERSGYLSFSEMVLILISRVHISVPFFHVLIVEVYPDGPDAPSHLLQLHHPPRQRDGDRHLSQ
jgi:glutathione synthase